MIKTNRMCIEFNKENIQRDFDIYVISKNSEKGKKENFFGKNVLFSGFVYRGRWKFFLLR